MIELTIDGRRVEVQPGATVLEAARMLGIHIPTLCHVPGLDPAASCFLCAVQVHGRPNLSPSCAMPVSNGMAVTTDSQDLREARKMALELLLSDHAGDCVAPCQARCPAGLDIAGFVHEIAAGDVRGSMEILLDRLALPGSLGRVCPRLCEQGCRRCDLDEGLAIGALHRYAADRDGEAPQSFVPHRSQPSGKSVAIVGAGPAGLAAALYLLQKGHACTLFDARAQPGGMLRYGIPAYRLPKEALDAEVELIRKLGARFRPRSVWGVDFTLEELRRNHDSVFLAIGAWQSQGLRCQGEELALSGIGLLESVASGGSPALGDEVIVIGGGNTAIDAARTALRLGASGVKVLYRRTRQEMPCLMEEVEAAELEGVQIELLTAPAGLRQANGQLELTCLRMRLGEPDDSGRRRPVPEPGSEFEIRCSAVIAAVGQSVDKALAEREGLETTGWGIAADPKSLATSLPGVFAGGDAVLGADLAVRAVAAGRIAAVSIDQWLSGKTVTGPAEMMNLQMMRAINDDERAALFREIENRPRPPVASLDLSRRLTSFAEVEAGLTDAQAETESRRCLTCGCRKADGCRMRNYATQYQVDPYRFAGERRRFSQDLTHPEIVYEPGKCILCDACVRVAAEAGEELGVAIIGRGFKVAMGIPFGATLSEGFRRAARRAAEVCPTGALALRSERSCDLGSCDIHLPVL